MKKLIVMAIVVLSAVLTQIGCKGSDGPQGPVGPAGPALTGSIVGFVQLSNEDHTYPLNKSGVTVVVAGTSISAVTDTTGKFTLNGVPTGTYDIIGSKAAYADAEFFSVQVTGGNTMYLGWWYGTLRLDHLPSFEMATVTAAPSGSNINVSGTISNSVSYYRYGMVFMGKTAATSSAIGKSNFLYTFGISPSTTSWATTVYQSDLNQAGFVTGDTVHFAAYSAGGQYWGSYYYDGATNTYTYKSVGTIAKTTTAVMP